MPVTAYFDTNVFDHIYKKINLTDAEIATLIRAIATYKVEILFSILNIEEVVALFDTDEITAREQIKLIVQLINTNKILKSHDSLINDDIISFAKNGYPDDPFIDDPSFISRLGFILNPSEKDIEEIKREINDPTRRQKEDFLSFMNQAKSNVVNEIKGKGIKFPDYISFEAKLAPDIAVCIAESKGVLEECKQRGIDKLLKVRSISIYIHSWLSLLYAQLFEKREPRISDQCDLFHATVSGSADVFVSNDSKFTYILRRISAIGFKVMNLRDFIRNYC